MGGCIAGSSGVIDKPNSTWMAGLSERISSLLLGEPGWGRKLSGTMLCRVVCKWYKQFEEGHDSIEEVFRTIISQQVKKIGELVLVNSRMIDAVSIS